MVIHQKDAMLFLSCIFCVHFVVVIRNVTTIDNLHKETNQQRSGEEKPFTCRFAAGSALRNYPALLEITGRCETRGVYAPQGRSDSPRV